MRLFGLWCITLCLAVFTVAAQTPQMPVDHPPVPAGNSAADASALTERLRPSGTVTSSPVPRKNLIDEFIFSKMEKDGISHAPLASDEEFFRRVHVDLTGRIPTDDELRAFLDNKDADKRDKLVDRLTETNAYKSRWTYFLADLFKAGRNRIGTEAKVLFIAWLRDNIHLDRPYNQLVTEMLTANAVSNYYVGPASYLARWVVLAVACDDEVHEDTSEEIAVHAARHFLGVDLTCVSCHDGAGHLEKINTYLTQRKREETWQMGSFFGKANVLRRTEVDTGKDEYSVDDNGPGFDPSARTVIRVDRWGKPGLLEPRYMFTGERPDSAKNPRSEFARMLTADPQFTRHTANLLWAEMFGTGIVDPPFSWDLSRIDPKNPPPAPWTLQPSHPELIEALGQYFRDNNYSFRAILRLIAKSNAYQLSSQFPGEWKASYAPYFARHFVRRMKAEAVYDSIVTATGIFTDIPIRATTIKVKYAYDASADDFEYSLPELFFFLETFGQENRESGERSDEGSITQAIMLMNSPFIQRQIQVTDTGKPETTGYVAKLLKENLTEEEKITRVFQRFLVRQPTQAEMSNAKEILRRSTEANKGWENLQWLLINKVEFVHNF